MSYCNQITADNILNKMNRDDLVKQVDKCEEFCEKYHQCDTVFLMLNEIRLRDGECIKCPYCERYMDFDECEDLFNDGDIGCKEQYQLLKEIQNKGYNIVTCGHCKQVFIHKI